ncbi:MAG TPA: SgcJ/EcaC family oxidoreductase [Terriglobales bacterium]|nr:SgcJ/EcaC family oxidoreductase [Terriglobales bacterium]
MSSDEQDVRDLVAAWMEATAAGDISKLLGLMAEDVVFLIAGKPPMRGRDAFEANFKEATQQFRIEAKSDIQEVEVEGTLAYCWNQLTVTMTPLSGGTSNRRSGPVLSVFRKGRAGNWELMRDANLLTAMTG